MLNSKLIISTSSTSVTQRRGTNLNGNLGRTRDRKVDNRSGTIERVTTRLNRGHFTILTTNFRTSLTTNGCRPYNFRTGTFTPITMYRHASIFKMLMNTRRTTFTTSGSSSNRTTNSNFTRNIRCNLRRVQLRKTRGVQN